MATDHIIGEELRRPDPGKSSSPGKAYPTDLEAQNWASMNLERARQRYNMEVMKGRNILHVATGPVSC